MRTSTDIRQLRVGFAILIVLTALVTALSLHQLQREEALLSKVVDDFNARALLAQNMFIAARDRLAILQSIASEEDVFEQEELRLRIYELGETFLANRQQLVAMHLDEREHWLLEQHRAVARKVVPMQRKMIDLAFNGDHDQARNQLITYVIPGQTQALAHLTELIRYEQQRGKITFDKARSAFKANFYYVLLLGAAVLIGGTLIAIHVTRYINHLMSDLKTLNLELEQRVEERTRELTTLNKSLSEEMALKEEAQDKLEKLANYDHLTGLPNRVLFSNSLDAELSRASRFGRLLALMFVDLDGFKQVNDRFGHDYGDELLRQVAVRLRDELRTEDSVARLGGDEFTITLSDVENTEQVAVVARKVSHLMSDPFMVLGKEVRIGSSIGIAMFPEDGEDRDSLTSRADEAMYQVKHSGKNGFRFFESAAPVSVV